MQNFRAYETIKDHAKKILKDYEKVIIAREEVENEDTNKLIQTIKDKIASINENKKTLPKAKKKYKNDSSILDLKNTFDDDFRQYNDYIPKITIHQDLKNKSNNHYSSEFYQMKESKLFDMEDNLLEKSDFLNFKKINDCQKYKPDPHFLRNKYLEIKYTEVSEKNYLKEKLNFNLLLKRKNENKDAIFYPDESSPLFHKYAELVFEQERAKKRENQLYERLKDDDSIFETKEDLEEQDNKKKKETSHMIGKNRLNDNQADPKSIINNPLKNYQSWAVELLSHNFKQEPINNKKIRTKAQIDIFNSIITETGLKIIDIQTKDLKYDPKEPKEFFSYDAKSITFGISLTGMVDKLNVNTQKKNKRGIIIEGPIVTWTRVKGQVDTQIHKGWFDLRKADNKIPDKNEKNSKKTDNNQEFLQKIASKEDGSFTIKNFYKGKQHFKPSSISDKENPKDAQIKFHSEKLEELGNKTYPEVLQQIKYYYSSLFPNPEKDDFPKLRYLSDPLTVEAILPLASKKRESIEIISWHQNLKRLILKGLDVKNNFQRLFSLLAENKINLEYLCLEATNTSSNTFDLDNQALKNYFANNLELTDVHFINYKFESFKSLMNLLLSKVFTITKDPKIFGKYKYDIPYKNISIKKTLNDLTTSEIDLNELYNFFKTISVNYGNVHSFKTPFGKLDLSGSETTNIEGLIRIVNDFKIIRELNLSNTKYSDYKNKFDSDPTKNILINYKDFLPSLAVKFNFPQIDKDFGNDGIFFDYSNNMLPLLEHLYLYDTPITKETFTELLFLFKVIIGNIIYLYNILNL
jgi:hypothetical protein